nr:DUF222 domain-containing protein [Actinomycetota bacterium]
VTQRRLLACVREWDLGERWLDDGCRDMAQWLSGRFGISHFIARRWVHAAHALERLPLISAALEDGVVGLDKVLELARFATQESEDGLIRWARRVSLAAVRNKAELAARRDIVEARSHDGFRGLRWCFNDGRMGLFGEFPAAQGSAIASAISRIAERLPELPPDLCFEGYPDSSEAVVEQRRADALWALAAAGLAQDPDADRATVVVHTMLGSATAATPPGDPTMPGPTMADPTVPDPTVRSVDVAVGESPGCALECGEVVHPEIGRRLSCDARLQVVLEDPDGNALGIGRAGRNIPAWLMRQLRYRDHGCSFPGCGTRAFLQAHHIVHWEHGGTTDLDNLTLVCCFHHKLVHEYGWRVALDDDSMATWFRRSGRRHDSGPDPPLRLDIDRPSESWSGPPPQPEVGQTKGPNLERASRPDPFAVTRPPPMTDARPPEAESIDEGLRDRELLAAAF